MIIEERGKRCEICGTENGPLHAHEVWEYIDAADVGIDLDEIRKSMAEWRGQAEEIHDARLRASLLNHNRPVVRALIDIQWLCQPCHVCKHSYDRRYMSHWCRVNRASSEEFHKHYKESTIKRGDSLTIFAYYSGYDELPNYKTFKERRDIMQDEADLCNEIEDDWRIYGGENEREAIFSWMHKTWHS